MISNDQEPNWTKIPAWVWLIIVICGVVFVQVLYGIFVFQRLGPDMAVRGQFGDIFGGINALFTGLAFAGVIYTILLQRRELELQREELRLNRAELGRSAQAQINQVARLEEAAELSAITSLLDVYTASLQPFWDSTRELRTNIGGVEAQLDAATLSSERDYLRRELMEFRRAYEVHEEGWIDILEKHQRLVERLEQMVEQKSQENSRT